MRDYSTGLHARKVKTCKYFPQAPKGYLVLITKCLKALCLLDPFYGSRATLNVADKTWLYCVAVSVYGYEVTVSLQ